MRVSRARQPAVCFLATALLALLLACGSSDSAGPEAAPPSSEGLSLRLELPDAWQAAGRADVGALFRYSQAPDVQLHLSVHREPPSAPARNAGELVAALTAQLQGKGVEDVVPRVTAAGAAMVAFSEQVESQGRQLFTRRWVMVRPEESGQWLRADVVLGMPAAWRSQPAAGQVIASLDSRLLRAKIVSGAGES